jgi:hypothetical protein
VSADVASSRTSLDQSVNSMSAGADVATQRITQMNALHEVLARERMRELRARAAQRRRARR